MGNKVRIGIIGLGNMGSNHVGSVGRIENAQLTAVCDIDREKARKFAKLSGAKAFYDAADLFRSGLVDGVIIAVPHYDHTPLTIAAFEAGLHVLTEKPIAVHKADAQRMIAAHKAHPKLRFAAMFQQRTLKAHLKLKQLISDGEIGRIMRVNWIITNWFRTQTYYNSGGWRATWRGEGGGVLLNQCPHQLDLFQWLFGMPVMLQTHLSIGKYHQIEVEDDVNTYCEFANGATGNFITTTGECPGTNRLEITGTRGRMVLEDGKISFLRTEQPVDEFCASSPQPFATTPQWNITVPYDADSANQHQDVIANFVAAIADPQVKLIAEAEEGIRSVELANAMIYSGLNKTAVKLPLNAAQYERFLKKLIATSRFVKKDVKAVEADMNSSFNRK